MLKAAGVKEEQLQLLGEARRFPAGVHRKRLGHAQLPAISLTGLARAFSRIGKAQGDKNSNARATTIATSVLAYNCPVPERAQHPLWTNWES